MAMSKIISCTERWLIRWQKFVVVLFASSFAYFLDVVQTKYDTLVILCYTSQNEAILVSHEQRFCAVFADLSPKMFSEKHFSYSSPVI